MDVTWPRMSRLPILSNTSFQASISKREANEDRAVSKADRTKLLKVTKEENIRNKGSSSVKVTTSTKRSLNNYMVLLLQLDSNQSQTKNVQ